MSLVLTRPNNVSGGSSGLAGQNISDVVVDPLVSKIVDTVESSLNTGVKWILTIKNQTSGLILIQEVLAVQRDGSAVSHNRYGLVGDIIPHGVDVVIGGGGDMELIISNPMTLDTYFVDITRLQVLD